MKKQNAIYLLSQSGKGIQCGKPSSEVCVLSKVIFVFTSNLSVHKLKYHNKAYVGHVEQLWPPAACGLNANCAWCLIIGRRVLKMKQKTDAQLSLAADKQARAKTDKNRQ